MQVLYLSIFFSIAFFLSWVPIALFAHACGDVALKKSACQDIYLVALCSLLIAFLLVPADMRTSVYLFSEFKKEFLQIGVIGAVFSAFCVLHKQKKPTVRIAVSS